MMKNVNSAKLSGGQAVITAVIFMVVISVTVIFGMTVPAVKQLKVANDFTQSRQSNFAAEMAVEDVYRRLQNGKPVAASEVMTVDGGTVTTSVVDVPQGKRILAVANVDGDVRKIQADLVLGTGIAFHYGVQAGNGGFYLSNSSSVTGNIFSGGPVIGSGGNKVYGDIVSAGPSGLVYGIEATGSVYAHTIGSSQAFTKIDKDAYYGTTLVSALVAGNEYPNSADQPVLPMPISDEQITEWEQDALAGGILNPSFCDSFSVSSNTCTISSNKTLGPKKIPFNLLLKTSSGILTITGPLWVTGNITAQTGPTIRISPTLGNKNVAIIADDPWDRAAGSVIDIGQSTVFEGSGVEGSLVFMISQNNSAENGGSVSAISMSQGASAVVAYAIHGLISLSQSVSLKEVTAYKISLSQSANVTYDLGLPSTIFSSGPGGGYTITSWKEVE